MLEAVVARRRCHILMLKKRPRANPLQVLPGGTSSGALEGQALLSFRVVEFVTSMYNHFTLLPKVASARDLTNSM